MKCSRKSMLRNIVAMKLISQSCHFIFIYLNEGNVNAAFFVCGHWLVALLCLWIFHRKVIHIHSPFFFPWTRDEPVMCASATLATIQRKWCVLSFLFVFGQQRSFFCVSVSFLCSLALSHHHIGWKKKSASGAEKKRAILANWSLGQCERRWWTAVVVVVVSAAAAIHRTHIYSWEYWLHTLSL